MNPRRLLTIGLDAANPFLLREWAADGTLPTLSALMEEGLTFETRSVEGMYVGASWPSFYTGTDPSDHGIYWLDRLIVGTYREQRCRPQDFGAKPALWEVLSRAGRRVLVMDVPLSRRSPRLNGLQIVEWGVHDAAFGFQTTPRSLRKNVLRTVGPHPAPPHCDRVRSAAEHRAFADQLIAGAQARATLTSNLLRENDWDFAVQVFSETHCGGHQLWHTHDPAHPAFASTRAGDTNHDLLREVYVAVDAALGRILAEVDAGTTVAVFSLHGMSSACGGSLLLPEILSRLAETPEYWSRASELAVTSDAASDAPAREGLVRRAYRLVPHRIRTRAYRLRQEVNQRWLGRGSEIDLDPSRAKAFYVGFGVGSTFSGIRLNLQGREPSGLLRPGSDEDRFCEQLIDDLSALVRPDSGTPLVRRVLRTRDRFEGPFVPALPDLLVEWEPDPAMGTTAAGNGAGSVWKAYSDKVGLVEVQNHYCRTGEHRIEGMTVIRGPAIEPGRLERSVPTLDLAPTFAKLLECSMDEARGRPIPEVVRLVGG